MLVLVAVAELSITRLAVPTLAPKPRAGDAGDVVREPVPLWYEVLDNLGLFLLYFGTTLAVGVLALRAWELIRRGRTTPVVAAGRIGLAASFAAVAVIAAIAMVAEPSPSMSLALHVAWAAAIVGVVAAALVRRDDLGVAIGLAAIALPLLVHFGAIFAGNVVLSEDELGEGSLIERSRDWGLRALVLAALVTPYCFSPRPMVRAVTRIAPITVAMLIGGLAAVLVRREYKAALDLASLGVGIDLAPGVPAGDMALYLLGIATLAWTLTACALADSEARREVGMGLGMVVLGGYGFDWPFHFLLGIVGMVVIAEAAPRLADEESPRALRPRTPPIDDEVWATWVQQLAAALRKEDADVKSVTVRGDDDSATTVLVGERHGVPYKARFGRLGGALVSIDVVCGREVSEAARATFTLYARPDGHEPHPAPPPAAPTVRVDDASFSARFRVRGDAAAVEALLDEPLRARATAMIDGWVAWWAGQSLRHRVYPAIGAPLDHPAPISDLAMRGAGATERMCATIELLCAIAARGLADVTAGEDEPAVLE